MAFSASTRARLWRRRVRMGGLAWVSAAAMVAGCVFSVGSPQAQAQTLMQFPTVPDRPKPQPVPRPAGEKSPMLLQATEVQYDYTNHRVSAVGNVQIYYDGSTLEADKVTYDEQTKRLNAEGNVRLTDADGKITYAEFMNLSDDFRDGFVDSLRLDGSEQTRMAAASAERSARAAAIRVWSAVSSRSESTKPSRKSSLRSITSE